VVINKADLDPDAATRARAQITSALRLLGHPYGDGQGAAWRPPVLQLSAIKGEGLEAFWNTVSDFHAQQLAHGRLAQRRSDQDRAWMWERISAGLQQRFRQHAAVQAALPTASADVRAGRVAPSVAARQLLALLDAPRT